MSLFEQRAEIDASAVDAVDEVLLESGSKAWSIVENAIERRAWIVGIFRSEREAREGWEGLKELLPTTVLAGPVLRELGNADWRDSYKAHFHAWQFGRLHWVPEWERETFRLPEGDAVLWLDPGLAFGTGNHETTRLCVERLVEIAQRRGVTGKVVDAGCGSGILALSAVKLGFRDVIGFDNDPEAVRVSEENAALNGLTDAVSFACGDLVGGLAGVRAEVLLANILADVLMRFARELLGAVAPGGVLVLSGILVAEGARVREVFAEAAPEWPQDSRRLGEWCDVVLTRPAAD